MPWREGTTVAEARQIISDFLRETGCNDICAVCPVYPGGEGCCMGCQQLDRETGCTATNLSCLSYTCGVLNEHLHRQDRLGDLRKLTYGIPREGYRGHQRREDDELLQIRDPLREIAAKVCILPAPLEEESSEQ